MTQSEIVLAAESGNSAAAEKLADIYNQKGKPEPAIRWHEYAAELGNPKGTVNTIKLSAAYSTTCLDNNDVLKGQRYAAKALSWAQEIATKPTGVTNDLRPSVQESLYNLALCSWAQKDYSQAAYIIERSGMTDIISIILEDVCNAHLCRGSQLDRHFIPIQKLSAADLLDASNNELEARLISEAFILLSRWYRAQDNLKKAYSTIEKGMLSVSYEAARTCLFPEFLHYRKDRRGRVSYQGI